jgi:hypothetical protein
VKRAVKLAAVAGAALLLGAEGKGCGDREVDVQVVRAAARCAVPGQGYTARWVGSPDALADVFPAPLGAGETAPAVDFRRDRVLVVGMGPKPTGGFALELARPNGWAKGETAVVQVAVREPAPGAMVTQALTSPCLALAIPREGIVEVKVVDEKGAVLASARVR